MTQFIDTPGFRPLDRLSEGVGRVVRYSYGPCPECGLEMTEDDVLHSWTDDLSDVHAECCPECNVPKWGES